MAIANCGTFSKKIGPKLRTKGTSFFSLHTESKYKFLPGFLFDQSIRKILDVKMLTQMTLALSLWRRAYLTSLNASLSQIMFYSSTEKLEKIFAHFHHKGPYSL